MAWRSPSPRYRRGSCTGGRLDVCQVCAVAGYWPPSGGGVKGVPTQDTVRLSQGSGVSGGHMMTRTVRQPALKRALWAIETGGRCPARSPSYRCQVEPLITGAAAQGIVQALLEPQGLLASVAPHVGDTVGAPVRGWVGSIDVRMLPPPSRGQSVALVPFPVERAQQAEYGLTFNPRRTSRVTGPRRYPVRSAGYGSPVGVPPESEVDLPTAGSY